MRNKTFWMLTLLNSLIPFLQAGINFHIYPFVTDQGYSETIGVLILGAIAISGIVGGMAWGMMTERFLLQRLITINCFGNGLIFLLFYWTITLKTSGFLGTGFIFFLAISYGLFHGGRNVMISVTWAEFFGRRSLGSIYSLSNPFHTTSNALGPIFGALSFDILGSYAFPFHFFVLTFFLSGLIALRLRRPTHPSQTAL